MIIHMIECPSVMREVKSRGDNLNNSRAPFPSHLWFSENENAGEITLYSQTAWKVSRKWVPALVSVTTSDRSIIHFSSMAHALPGELRASVVGDGRIQFERLVSNPAGFYKIRLKDNHMLVQEGVKRALGDGWKSDNELRGTRTFYDADKWEEISNEAWYSAVTRTRKERGILGLEETYAIDFLELNVPYTILLPPDHRALWIQPGVIEFQRIVEGR